MSKSALAPEELKAQRTAQRRRELQERLQAERVQGELKQQIKERNEARLAELREQELQGARSAQLREAARSANELELLAAESRAVQRKVQFREEERSTHLEKTAERTRQEQESYTAELRRQEEEKQIRLRAGRQEEQRLTRQQAEMARALREEDLHAEILQRREKEKQARSPAVKLGEEEQLALRQSEIKARRREPEIPNEAPTQAQRDERSRKTAMLARENRATALRDEQRVAEADAAERKQKEEVRAEQRQLRADRERLRDAEEQRAAEAAKMRQAALQAELEMQQAALVAPRKSLVQKAEPAAVPGSKRRLQSVSPAPRAPTAAGSMARAAANVDASPPALPDTAPYVQTRGNFIIDENGDAVYLRGVTVRGLDTAAPLSGQTFPAALSLDSGNLASITGQWGANLVRLPFAANTVLSGNGTLSSNDLLAGLDLTVAAITEAGAYVLLGLEAAAGSQPSDANTLQVWKTLSLRYQNEPRVFYEVFCSSAPITGSMLAQFPSLVATVRQQNPASLIFLSAGAGGADVSGVPVFAAPGDPVPNIVYTVAVVAQNLSNQDELSAASTSYPLFASVWSDDGTDLGRLSTHVADLFERYGIGWSAANWNADPRLVADAAGQDFTPTIWGHVAQRALKLTVPPLLEPSDAPASLSALRAGNPKLAQLTTSGSFIVGSDGKAISLRGVTVVGLDAAAPASGQTLPSVLALDENNLALMRETWGLNLVRLPFQAQTVLSGNGALSAGKVLAGLDLAVALLSDAGLYVLLALEAPAGGGGPPGPDASTAQVWQMLAKRYMDEPALLYEIFASATPLAPNWLQAVTTLVGTIRQQNSTALIFVGSGNGGVDVTGLPLLLPTGDPVFNVVYTVNASPQSPTGPDDGPLAVFAESYPVFASTWSDDPNNVSRLSPYVAEFFGRHGVGWAASNWNADPRLVTDAVNHDFSATAWGLIAGRAATLPVRPLLKPF